MSRPWVGDVALAVVVLVAELGQPSVDLTEFVLTGDLTSPAVARNVRFLLIGVGAAGLMLLRRRHPVVVAGLVGVLYVVGAQAPAYDAPVSAMVIALYTVGRHTSGRIALAATAPALAAGWLLHEIALDGPPPAVVSFALMPAMPVAAGYVVRLRGELSERREQRVAEDAVREERRRIARELHDVIAHHVSVVGCTWASPGGRSGTRNRSARCAGATARPRASR
ncbi:hypothetical protein ITP53_41385 [Nonomuraea sp. K274]|uniref:histidine kinase n=1 Tax=Nonomuraea cypriaca TaxID=1187855 RepID=A0A931AKE9_9ACTN|nr:histidine kinase [Nonomuraea cypriaca]MBF8192029.1 hypothetical protein [Nonomuraea cypriaca]